MGDRANVLVRESSTDPGVWLYTHWHGHELPQIVQDALASSAGAGRFSDTPYLTRIIFEEMLSHTTDKETGFGISSFMTDNSYPIIVVTAGESVGYMSEGETEPYVTWTREQFVEREAKW